jgi:hypothetical protein
MYSTKARPLTCVQSHLKVKCTPDKRNLRFLKTGGTRVIDNLDSRSPKGCHCDSNDLTDEAYFFVLDSLFIPRHFKIARTCPDCLAEDTIGRDSTHTRI